MSAHMLYVYIVVWWDHNNSLIPRSPGVLYVAWNEATFRLLLTLVQVA